MANDSIQKQFEADFAEFLEVETAGLYSQEDTNNMKELEAAMSDAGLETDLMSDGEDTSLFQFELAGGVDPLFFNFIKRRAERLIKKLYEYVKKYAKLAKCIPLVTKAAALFAAKKYVAAITAGLQAMNCIRQNL